VNDSKQGAVEGLMYGLLVCLNIPKGYQGLKMPWRTEIFSYGETINKINMPIIGFGEYW